MPALPTQFNYNVQIHRKLGDISHFSLAAVSYHVSGQQTQMARLVIL